MAEQLERFARPSSVLEHSGVMPARGINRGHLTLYLSVAAIILSIASAGTHLFIYLNGERPKMAAETELARTLKTKEEALARAAQLDVALKAQQIKTSEAQEQEARAGKVEHLASAKNHYQDVAKKVQETEVVSAQARIAKGVVTPTLVNSLSRSASFGVSGEPSPVSAPGFDSRRQGAGSMPIGRPLSAPSIGTRTTAI